MPSIKELAELKMLIDEMKEKGEDVSELEKQYKTLISHQVRLEMEDGGIFDFDDED